MNYKRLFALVLAIIIICSCFAGCRKIKIDDSYISSFSSDAAINYSDVEIMGDSSEAQSIIASTTDDASQSSQNSSNSTTTNNTTSTSTSDGTSTSDTVVVDDPVTNLTDEGKEIYGSGTTNDPYIDFPDAEAHTVRTLTIPAGKSVFYSIARVGGRIFTINDASVYVVCDGTKHTAQNGVLSFKVVDALASEAVLFEIGNTASVDKAFTIVFTDLQGSMANPTIISSISNEFTVALEEGNELGHFYKYVAEQDGILKFYLLSGTEKGILLATNNRNSAQRSTESTDEGEVKTDEIGTYVELEVQKGDEIIIHVGSKPNKRGKYPATEIKWLAKY